MPVYVYRNLTTGETFEVEQSIREDAWTTHPETGDPVKRIVQPVGIAFKGSGFYVNDSRNTGAKNGAAKSKPAMEAGTNDGATKSESKTSSSDSGSSSTTKPASSSAS